MWPRKITDLCCAFCVQIPDKCSTVSPFQSFYSLLVKDPLTDNGCQGNRRLHLLLPNQKAGIYVAMTTMPFWITVTQDMEGCGYASAWYIKTGIGFCNLPKKKAVIMTRTSNSKDKQPVRSSPRNKRPATDRLRNSV